jgi:hypothetical protein
MPEIRFKVSNTESGGEFTVRIIEEGQYFGRGMCLMNEGPTLIEFYDANQGRVEDTEGNVLGCSIGKPRLLSDLLQEIHSAPAGYSLQLHPTVAKWSLDYGSMMELMGHVSKLDLIEQMPLAQPTEIVGHQVAPGPL